ncbi:MAG: ribonuclease P protein component [Candidatus Nanopelagicales bacterium]
MLPVRSRLKDRNALTSTIRRGQRARHRSLVIHYLQPQDPCAQGSSAQGPQVAFAVNKAVGNSVVRHRVVRRLRHVMVGHLAELPSGSSLVVRALPSAASASSADFDRDISVLLPKVVTA